MKKIFSIVLCTALLATCLVGCQKNNEIASGNSNNQIATGLDSSAKFLIINSEPFTVTPEAGFDDYGVSEYICDSDDVYTFTAKNSDGITWSIYLSNDKFTGSFKDLKDQMAPELVGNGSIPIRGDQYVYVECSASSESASDIPDGAVLEITRYSDAMNKNDSLAGNYQDRNSQKANLTITDAEDGYNMVIDWADSASENNEWTMTAKLGDENRLEYSDCQKYKIVYDDAGNETKSEEYTSSSGFFSINNGRLYWDGAGEPELMRCVFEKVD